MTDITHLVVNGCSWTYGQGLEDPKTQGWPALLAKKLGVEVVNLAVNGCGNGSIHRRTYEYVYENLPTGSKPFFVIAWSQYWRKETWVNKFGHDEYYDYSLVTFSKNGPSTNAERALLDNWNDLDFYRQTYLNKLSLIALFNSYNIPYLMSDYSNEHSTQVIEEIRSRFPTLVSSIFNNKKQVKPFCIITKDYPKLQCGHDGIESQEVLADYIVSEIDNQYGKLNVIPSEYLTLKNFKFTNKIDSLDNQSVWR
jgi:hypothetical protein